MTAIGRFGLPRLETPPPLSVPPITTLPSSSPSRPTNPQVGANPDARLPTRAPPLRAARLRATQAIRAAVGGQVLSSPTVQRRPVRRTSPSGSRTRPVLGMSYFFP